MDGIRMCVMCNQVPAMTGDSFCEFCMAEEVAPAQEPKPKEEAERR